ncbi:serine/threonine protein kinase, partial [Enterococcus hirae]
DLAGNVWEWCDDAYRAYRSDSEEAPASNGHDKRAGRVLRGGSWSSLLEDLTVHRRSTALPGKRSPRIGFRCAIEMRALEERP